LQQEREQRLKYEDGKEKLDKLKWQRKQLRLKKKHILDSIPEKLAKKAHKLERGWTQSGKVDVEVQTELGLEPTEALHCVVQLLHCQTGDSVMAIFSPNGQTYPAEIASINGDGTITVNWRDRCQTHRTVPSLQVFQVAENYAGKQDTVTPDNDLPSLAERVASLAAEVDVLRSLLFPRGGGSPNRDQDEVNITDMLVKTGTTAKDLSLQLSKARRDSETAADHCAQLERNVALLRVALSEVYHHFWCNRRPT